MFQRLVLSLPTRNSNYTLVGLKPYQEIEVTVQAQPGNPFTGNISSTVRCRTNEASK